MHLDRFAFALDLGNEQLALGQIIFFAVDLERDRLAVLGLDRPFVARVFFAILYRVAPGIR